MYSQTSKWAAGSIITTLLTTVLIIGLWISFRYFLPGGGGVTAWLLPALLFVLCFAALLFFPLKTRVGDGCLSVVFPLRVKRLLLADITEVSPYTPAPTLVRLCGSGGFFGWWGWFRDRSLGRLMVYAANLADLILVETSEGRRYVISCSDPTDMTAAVRKAIAERS